MVKGLLLADGREVVVKVRPPSSRLAGCGAVHRALWQAGFPCPEPLVDLQPLSGFAASAETFVVSAGEPPPDSELPWLDRVAAEVRDHLRGYGGRPMIGHGDWHPGNVHWQGQQLLAVHDWDSMICQPEAAIAGLAAASFHGIDPPLPADVDDSATFLDAYQQARGCRWTSADCAASWAAGLWQRAFDAKTLSAGGTGQILSRREAQARLRLAGLNPGLAAEAPQR